MSLTRPCVHAVFLQFCFLRAACSVSALLFSCGMRGWMHRRHISQPQLSPWCTMDQHARRDILLFSATVEPEMERNWINEPRARDQHIAPWKINTHTRRSFHQATNSHTGHINFFTKSGRWPSTYLCRNKKSPTMCFIASENCVHTQNCSVFCKYPLGNLVDWTFWLKLSPVIRLAWGALSTPGWWRVFWLFPTCAAHYH